MPSAAIETLVLSGVASGAIAARRAVGFNDAQATAQGQKVKGVAKYAAADTADVAIIAGGVVVVEAGAAIAIGNSLIADSQGRAIPSTGGLALGAGAVAVTSSAANGAVLTGGDAPEFVFADALQAAAAAGEFIEALLR